MPIYRYENAQGATREVFASMAKAPGMVLVFPNVNDPSDYREAAESELVGVDCRDIRKAPHDLFFRVLGTPAVMVPNHTVNYSGLPASRSLPRRKLKDGKLDKLGGHDVFRFKDGGYTTTDGRPIVQNKDDAQREAKRSGMAWD